MLREVKLFEDYRFRQAVIAFNPLPPRCEAELAKRAEAKRKIDLSYEVEKDLKRLKA